MSNLVLLFELTIFIMEGCSTHGGKKFRGRKVFKVKAKPSLGEKVFTVKAKPSLEGERSSKLRKNQV